MFALGGWSTALLLRYLTEDGGHMEPVHRGRGSLEEDGGVPVRLISCCSGAMMGTADTHTHTQTYTHTHSLTHHTHSLHAHTRAHTPAALLDGA